MATAKKTAAKSTGKQTAKKSAVKSGERHYTDEALRERLKKEVIAGDKGGRKGQWSARKAQLLAHEYEAAGGGYTGVKTESQKHLEEWGDEHWQTRDGKPAERGKTMARYLPEKAWEELSPAERKRTDAKKKKASRTGKQFVKNTPKAAKAGAKARHATQTTGGGVEVSIEGSKAGKAAKPRAAKPKTAKPKATKSKAKR